MIDHSGEIHGEWLLLEKIDKRKYLAKCSCGKIKEVYYTNLKSGKSTNCGCVQSKHIKERMTTHGKSRTKLYRVWSGMKRRCHNKNSKDFPDYGGRGIDICEEWNDSFEKFYNWAIENGYEEGKVEIDRINVNGNYEPNNCRWITKKQNARNKRNNHYVEYNNKIYTISELSEMVGIDEQTILNRMKRGWSVEDSILPIYSKGDGKFKPLYTEVRGENLTLEEIANKYNLKIGCVKGRYNKGLRGEDLIKEVNPKNISKQVLCYDLEGNFICEFNSIKDASEKLNIGRSAISNICNNKIKNPKKYIFKFKEEN